MNAELLYLKLLKTRFVSLFVLVFLSCLNGFGQTTYTAIFGTPGTNTWTIPPGVTTITVTCIGGGGAGGGAGNNSNTSGGGGGGGASVTVSNYAVTAGQTVSLNVGSGGTGVSNANGNAGGATYAVYASTTFISAAGGSGGTKASNGVGGAGGAIANNIPVNTGFKGGNGGNGVAGTNTTNNFSGSGGGGAGTTSAGGNATNSTSSSIGSIGSGGATYGGAGAVGLSTSGNTGQVGNASNATATTFGGGGGGATVWSSGSQSGGNGANGGIIITYTIPSTVTILTWTSSGSWSVPANVCQVWVECWGGGGGGGGVNNTISAAAGGGGGGGYTLSQNVTVTPSTSISYTIGAGGLAGTNSGGAGGTGGTTTFSSPTPVSASGGGGGGGSTSGSTAGAGGASGSGSTHNGGTGASGSAGTRSGGGGAGAGIAVNGNNASGLTGGMAYTPFGGTGANGLSSLGNGAAGSSPGGGGSGGYATSSVASWSGGAGGAGKIILMYYNCPVTCTPPTSVTLSASSTSLCAGGSTNFTTSITGGSVNGGNWEYQFELTDGTVLQAWSTTSTYSPTNIAAATYSVVVKVRSSACNTTSTTSNTVVVTVTATPTTATVSSASLSVCGSLTSGSLGGNTPSTGTGAWSIVSGGTGTFSNSASSSSTFTASAYGTYVLRWTISNSPCTASTADVTVTFNQVVTWGTIQFPTSSTTQCNGSSFTVYGQVYGSNVTEAAGAGAGLTAELGWSTSNTNPSTWTNWTSASFNTQSGNNDEFSATLSGLATGTYYYAFRYAVNGCSYIYGGNSGLWSSNSGVLIINDCFGTYASAPNLTSCNTTVSGQGAFYNTTGTGADMINSTGTSYNSYNFGTYYTNSAGLILKGSEVKTWKGTGANVCSAKMYYRTYSGTPSGAFTLINLPYYDVCSGGAFPTGGPCNTNDQKWRDISQNIDLTTLSAGTYTLEVYYEITGSHTSTSGCGTTLTLNNSGANYTATFTLVNAPVASNTGPFCENATIQLNATAGGTSTYAWSGPNSYSSTSQNPSITSATTSMSGTYTVTASLGTGCTKTATTSVTVNALPSMVANNNGPICASQTLSLTATDGFSSYAWTGPNSFTSTSQNPSLTNFQAANAGTYTVTGTDANGCQATSSTSVSLTTSPNASSNSPVCVGGTLTLSTNSATSYLWSGPNSFSSTAQNPTVSASATTAMAGTYTVSVVGACAAATGVVDNFSDGNFTSSPVWTSQSGGWQIYNISSTQYLYGDNTATADIITTPSTQAYGTWNFDYSFQTTASTTSQIIRFFVSASTTGLSTTNGYYVFVDGGGNIFLRKLTGGTATTLITSTWTANTSWHTVKVIRNLDNTFQLYLDGVLKGTSAAESTYTSSSYIGFWNTGAIASDNHRVDNVSCTPPASATTTVTISTGPTIAAKTGTICSGSTYTLAGSGSDNIPVGTSYTWTYTANASITGATTGTAQSSFSQTLTNTSSLPQTIVYSVTPTGGGCAGTAFTVTITVDAPLAGGTVSTNQTICSGQTPSLLSNTTMPSGGAGLGLANSVQIGTQYWMNTNLDVLNYNDGTPVGTAFNTSTGAYTWYNNSYTTWGQYYGPLYNWYAVNTGKLCPSGWHVPTLAEWTTLINYASGSTTAGKKLKSCRTVTYGCATTTDPRWDANSSAFGTDDYGFNALPAGREYWSSGAKTFERIQTRTRFWTSTVNDASNARAIEMNYNTSDAPDSYYPYDEGYSVRCMGDNATSIQNSYTYQWQQDPGCTGTWSYISGANALTYQPGALTQTTCFRRVTTDGCGTAYSNTITITVNPSPAISNMTATICSGTAFTALPVDGTNGTVPSGTTYTWSTPSLSPASSISGGSAQATGQSSISQTLTNTTTANATATYTVTPTVGTCAGTSFTVTVTVLPPLNAGTVSGFTSGSGPNHLVIYQVYGAGGNSGATYTNDFVVLYNPTGSAVNLSGWSLQYSSSTSTSTTLNGASVIAGLTGTINSGGYFLVQLAAGTNTYASLPTADLSNNSIAMAASNGKVYLCNSTSGVVINSVGCSTSSNIIDFVGFGTANCSEGSSSITGLNTTNWATRKLNGCQDTDVNSADFTAGNTTTPKNSASPTNFCTTTTYSETLCAGQNATSMTVSGVSGGDGTYSYQWYYQNGSVTCPTGSSTTGWTAIAGATTASYTPTAVSATATYACFVTFTGANSCGGAWSTNCRVVTVNPAPIISNMTTTVCSGTAFSATPVNGTNGTVPSGTTYSWSAPTATGITGTAAGTAVSSVTGTLTNITTSPVTVVYTITPVTGTCTGSAYTLTVTVNPGPSLSNGTTSACTGVAFSYTPTGTTIPSGTTYSWSTPSGANFSGGAAGSNATTIDGTLTLTSGSATTATYTITPTSGTCSGTTFTLAVNLSNCIPTTPLVSCNLVVYKIGDGTTALSTDAFPVNIEEYSPSGNVVQTISNLFVGANLLTQSGASSSSGFLNSNNGFLAVPGLNSSLGTASVANSNTKVTHIIDASLTTNNRFLNASVAPIPFNNSAYRSVVPVSATTFYCTGDGSGSTTGGIWYYNGTSYIQIYNTIFNLRNIEIFNGNLYFTTGSGSNRGLYQVGSGLPTTSGQTATLIVSNGLTDSSPYNFSISPDGCTIYLNDDGNGGNTSIAGIHKWTKVNGTWTFQYKYTAFARGLVVDYQATTPKVYATTAISSGVVASNIIYLNDNGSFGTPVWTVNSGSNYSFAGIDFTPNSAATISNTNNVNAQSFSVCQNGTSQTLTVASATSSNALTYQWYSNTTNDLCGATIISGATSSTYTPPVSTIGTTYYFDQISSSCATTNYSSIASVTVNPNPTASITPSTLCQGYTATLTASGGGSYLWSPGGQTTNQISINSAGTYSVTVTDSNGCTNSASTTISVSNPPSINAISPP